MASYRQQGCLHDSFLHPFPWLVLFMHILLCNLDEEADIITITVSSGRKIAALYVVHLYAHNLDGGCISVCKQVESNWPDILIANHSKAVINSFSPICHSKAWDLYVTEKCFDKSALFTLKQNMHRRAKGRCNINALHSLS